MDPDILERLMMDRAAGGLSPDVEALLDAYAARDPAVGEHMRMWQQQTDTVRQALRDDAHPAPALPPFPRRQMPIAGSTRMFRAAGTLAAAALVAWALFVIQHKPPQKTVMPIVASLPIEAQRPAPAASGGFWSLSRMAAQWQQTAAQRESLSPPMSRQDHPPTVVGFNTWIGR